MYKKYRNQIGLLVWYLADRLVSPTVKRDESLILNGFWRSGTTWVQQVLVNALDAKPVFEPFSPRMSYSYNYLENMAGKYFTNEKIVKPFMPYVPSGGEWPLELERRVDQALHSTLPPHYFTYAGRNSFKDSCKRAVVVKFVRGSCLLPAISSKFDVPILHLRRDPRDIMASICRQPGWGEKVFDGLSVAEQLLDIPDGRAHVFESFRKDILSADKGSLVEKVITYWALTEWYIQQSKEYENGSIIVIKYEDLINASELEWMMLLGKLNLQAKREFSMWEINRPSFTSQKGRENALKAGRKNYNDILTSSEVSLIESIVYRYGLEEALL